MSEKKERTKRDKMIVWKERFKKIERGEITEENATSLDRVALEYKKFKKMKIKERLDKLNLKYREATIFDLDLKIGKTSAWKFVVKDDIDQNGAESTKANIMLHWGYVNDVEELLEELEDRGIIHFD